MNLKSSNKTLVFIGALIIFLMPEVTGDTD
ncbi:hypothetical protein FHX85_001624 [Clostridium beijerinckii]|nr:hypothetical protein [Clostridium beijerinckii]MBA2900156.1 hypothetical protein [Clostridium beijerinckii]MBA2909785.1 hypothetical protein [Clostridium beijerinckii]NSB83968.1 hypothetical protein [Clostridium beijerinckii]NYE52574.1 hypothetical protein [Clostridium beijerinckii]